MESSETSGKQKGIETMNEPKRLAGTKAVRTAVCTKHDKMVCDTFRIPIEEAEANAALIATCPILLHFHHESAHSDRF